MARLLKFAFVCILSSMMIGCSSIIHLSIANPDLSADTTPSFTATASSTPFRAVTNTPLVIPPSYTPTPTFTPTATLTPTPTDTPTLTPTSTPATEWNPGGYIAAPILLYHHVSDAGDGNRYYVSLESFRQQMEALRDWGYSTITPAYLAEVLINGGEVPVRPVVITFDDGNIDVYENAFPIMHEMGFVGAFYIVANRLQSNGYVNAEQLQEMAQDGWEIGSHGMSHLDLTSDYSIVHYEVAQSRATLESATGEPVHTIAYPYGLTDNYVASRVSDYGYRAAMGLGSSWEHSLGSLFYLSRIEVKGSYSIDNFAALLPWSE